MPDLELKKSTTNDVNQYSQEKSQQKPALSAKDQEKGSLARQKTF